MLNLTKVGAEFTKGREGELLQEVVAGLRWMEATPGIKVSMGTGMLVEEVVRSLPGGRVTHYAEGLFGRKGLVAVRREGFIGGPVNIYLMDCGSEAVVLASEQIAA